MSSSAAAQTSGRSSNGATTSLTSRKTDASASARTATINENSKLQSYYASLESRIGYRLVLGGTRHFGYYETEARRWSWRIHTALRRMEDELLKALNVPAGSRVLDAGCGVGHVAMRMAQKGDLQVEGIDIVERHLRRAAKNVQKAGLTEKEVHVQCGDYHHLDDLFDPASFDGLYTMETFVHATEPRAVLQQFLRVLKPGGHLAMHEYDHADYANVNISAEGRLASRAMTTVNEHAAMPANQGFGPGVLEAMLKEEGFEDVQIRDISRHIWPMLWFFYILAWIPFYFINLFGLEPYFVNTVAGYWSWRGREYWRYVQVTGRKPL